MPSSLGHSLTGEQLRQGPSQRQTNLHSRAGYLCLRSTLALGLFLLRRTLWHAHVHVRADYWRRVGRTGCTALHARRHTNLCTLAGCLRIGGALALGLLLRRTTTCARRHTLKKRCERKCMGLLARWLLKGSPGSPSHTRTSANRRAASASVARLRWASSSCFAHHSTQGSDA